MKLGRAFAPFTVLVLGSLASVALPALAQTPACVHWSGQAVHMGIGYNHVVSIENTCDQAAACAVSTDVAPDPIQATVAPKQRVELTTFRGSPATTFKAKVECKLQ